MRPISTICDYRSLWRHPPCGTPERQPAEFAGPGTATAHRQYSFHCGQPRRSSAFATSRSRGQATRHSERARLRNILAPRSLNFSHRLSEKRQHLGPVDRKKRGVPAHVICNCSQRGGTFSPPLTLPAKLLATARFYQALRAATFSFSRATTSAPMVGASGSFFTWVMLSETIFVS